MDRSMKLYTKAIKYYNEGYIDKAVEYCEKSISENLKNTSAINLKGLLYYLKGELENAQALWKMNYQVNRDVIAKKYLDDSRHDEDKKILYTAALKSIKELRLREALQMLEKCKQSDFNSININNYIALCYIKLGEYNEALKYINLVIKADKRNKTAANNKKELLNLGVIKKEVNVKYISIGAAAIVFLVFTIIGIKGIIKVNFISKEAENKNINLVLSNSVVENQPAGFVKESNQSKEQIEIKKEVEVFPLNEVETSISNKEYEKLNDLFFYWKDKDLSINQKNSLLKIKNVLSTEGIEFFYSNGRQAFSNKEYNKAINYFKKSLSFSEGHYLNPHIIYLLAASHKNISDIENAIKYFKQYDSNYSSGDYEDAVLYELCMIYKDIDSNEAKVYAKKITELYPKSIYNNSLIKGILSK